MIWKIYITIPIFMAPTNTAKHYDYVDGFILNYFRWLYFKSCWMIDCFIIFY